MEGTTLITSILTSTALAGAVSAVVALLVAERRIKVEGITHLRTTWRARIRELAAQLHSAIISSDHKKLSELRFLFTIVLNPHDLNDLEILSAIRAAPGNAESHAREVADRLALLLKHDWERVKWETTFFLFRGKPAERTSYEQYRKCQVTRVCGHNSDLPTNSPKVTPL